MELVLIVLLLAPATFAVRVVNRETSWLDLAVGSLMTMAAVVAIGELIFGSLLEGFGTFVLRPVLEVRGPKVGFASGAFWWQYVLFYSPGCLAAAVIGRWLATVRRDGPAS